MTWHAHDLPDEDDGTSIAEGHYTCDLCDGDFGGEDGTMVDLGFTATVSQPMHDLWRTATSADLGKVRLGMGALEYDVYSAHRHQRHVCGDCHDKLVTWLTARVEEARVIEATRAKLEREEAVLGKALAEGWGNLRAAVKALREVGGKTDDA